MVILKNPLTGVPSMDSAHLPPSCANAPYINEHKLIKKQTNQKQPNYIIKSKTQTRPKCFNSNCQICDKFEENGKKLGNLCRARINKLRKLNEIKQKQKHYFLVRLSY